MSDHCDLHKDVSLCSSGVCHHCKPACHHTYREQVAKALPKKQTEYEDEEMCSAMNPTKTQRNKVLCMEPKGHSGKHKSINSNGRTIRWDR